MLHQTSPFGRCLLFRYILSLASARRKRTLAEAGPCKAGPDTRNGRKLLDWGDALDDPKGSQERILGEIICWFHFAKVDCCSVVIMWPLLEVERSEVDLGKYWLGGEMVRDYIGQ